MSDLEKLASEFSCQFEEWLCAKIEEITDENGMVDVSQCDRIWAEQSALFDRVFSGWLRRAKARDPGAAELLRGELEALLAVLEKRTKDRLWPH